ncbi:substrate-binding periplasmic protein [Psychromonas aquimarina]|uniref:substrate-binding periplasmic protein n=1 Tax=Psychromonas aquimarina TaxID=444919 RepID=UPI00040F188F|nr:transporter substrate-binding domain-containing protein [Psychromonas aquimarina]
MRILYSCLILLSLFSIVSLSQPAALNGEAVIFCVEEGEWPPFNYTKRVNEQKTSETLGYDIDVINMIFSEYGIKAEFVVMPWKRCLLRTRKGVYQAVPSASSSPQREKDYLLSEAYYTITPSYFYLKKKYPHGLAIKNASELKKQGKICGRHGYNYVNFGLKNDDVCMGSRTYKSLVDMTLKGRCDIFLARYETFLGLSYIGQDFISDRRFGHAPIPNVEPEKFYIMISRNFKYAQELKAIIDSGILKLKSSGKLQSTFKKYVPSRNGSSELNN